MNHAPVLFGEKHHYQRETSSRCVAYHWEREERLLPSGKEILKQEKRFGPSQSLTEGNLAFSFWRSESEKGGYAENASSVCDDKKKKKKKTG